MLTSELVNKIIGEDHVTGIIKDRSFTETMVIFLLNEVQLEIAGGGERQHGMPLLAPLPELLTNSTVTLSASANSVAMPTDYHRGPVTVVDAQDAVIKSTEQHLDFLRLYPTVETGSTDLVCLKGNVLFYAPAQAQDVTIHYYKTPTDMDTDSASEPDGIPIHLQSRLLVSGVCAKIFQEIEADLSGKKGQTSFWLSRYQSAQTDLERFIGPVDQLPEFVRDDSDYVFNF